MTIAPAERSLATKGESRWVMLERSARLPAVVGNGPAISTLSLISTGWPAIGPTAAPDWSNARASGIAIGLNDRMEWIIGSTTCARSSARTTLASAVAGPAGWSADALAAIINASISTSASYLGAVRA